MTRRLIARAPIVGVAALALALPACGSDSLDSGGGGGDGEDGEGGIPTETFDVSKDDALAKKVPAEVADKGTLKVGTDASYAPNEFTTDGTTIVGMDIDLFTAVGDKLGLKTEYENAPFDAIINGVTSKKYDVGVSSFTINADRMKQVNMVSYFSAGTQWAAKNGKGGEVDPESPCGLKVSVQTGTVQQEEDLPAKEKECEGKGEPIEVLPFDGQDQATEALVTGRVDAMLADSPVTMWAIKQTGDKIETAGDTYDSAPYGFVIPKEQEELASAVAEALQSLKDDGTYDKILNKWGLTDAGVDSFEVNPKP